MPSKSTNLTSDLPTSINPYTVLQVPTTATAAEIKTAYKKLALRHHPDKVAPADRTAAHSTFQNLAFAYSILSDPARRTRYDTTGSTTESIIDSSDFNWTEYFSSQFKDIISEASIAEFKAKYQGSEQETADILAAYVKSKGDMDGVLERVMCSELSDEERFRKVIDGAIERKQVDALDKYTKESAGKKKQRVKRAMREEEEAKEAAKELGIYDKLFGGDKAVSNGRKGKEKVDKTEGDAELKALIMGRMKDRQEKTGSFLDGLAAKYGGGSGKRGRVEEPPEELFNKNAKRQHERRKVVQVAGDDEDEDGEEEEEEEKPKPKRKPKKSKESKLTVTQ